VRGGIGSKGGDRLRTEPKLSDLEALDETAEICMARIAEELKALTYFSNPAAGALKSASPQRRCWYEPGR
jgi:hypothetical protein